MNEQKQQSFLVALVLALAAFVAGFVIAWVIKPTSYQLVTDPVEATQNAAASEDSEAASTNGGAAESTPSGGASSDSAQPNSSVGATSGNSAQSNSVDSDSSAGANTQSETMQITEDGQYSSKDEVALYVHTYGHLPSNYISKTKARKAGWVAQEGNLWDVLPGMSIGGSEFYNDEGRLPDAPGRTWTECDVNYQGGYRGAERIVFSSDGLVFYTADHYETFEQLY